MRLDYERSKRPTASCQGLKFWPPTNGSFEETKTPRSEISSSYVAGCSLWVLGAVYALPSAWLAKRTLCSTLGSIYTSRQPLTPQTRPRFRQTSTNRTTTPFVKFPAIQDLQQYLGQACSGTAANPGLF